MTAKSRVKRLYSTLHKDAGIASLYEKWCEVNRQKLSMYHDIVKEPDVPLEDNKEFRSLKNAVIQAALEIDFTFPPAENYSNIGGLISQLARQIMGSSMKKLDALNKKTARQDARQDKKEMDKIAEKKLAHGLKPELLYTFIQRVDIYEKPVKYSRDAGNPIMIYYKFQMSRLEQFPSLAGLEPDKQSEDDKPESTQLDFTA